MKCPKCGAEIKFYNLKPNCKSCGVNIMYYTQESGLVRDAKMSELEFASARIFGAKLLAAFISGPLQIIRIITTVLCLASLIVPYVTFNISMPLFNSEFSVGGIGIYKMISSGSLFLMGSLLNSTLYSGVSFYISICLTVFIIAAFLCIALTVISILSFLDVNLFSKGAGIVSLCAAGYNIAAFFVILGIKFISTDFTYASMSLGFGAIVSAVILTLNGIINLLLSKKDIKLKIRENDIERREFLKAVKKGEISVDELSLPVFETEEEKQQRLKNLEEALKNEEEGRE